MRKFYILLVWVGILLSGCSRPTNLKEGDLAFQCRLSEQTIMLLIGTASPCTHVGIVMEGDDGQLYVYEALEPVRITPIEEYEKAGLFNYVWYKRATEETLKVNPEYVGKHYDYAFCFDNDDYYCSELVWRTYQDQFGIRLAEPRELSTFNIGLFEDVVKERGLQLNQLIVPPCDIQNSDKLRAL